MLQNLSPSPGMFKMDIDTSSSQQSVIYTTLDAEVQLLRQLMSGKDNTVKVDNSLGTNHLIVCCDVGQLTFEARF